MMGTYSVASIVLTRADGTEIEYPVHDVRINDDDPNLFYGAHGEMGYSTDAIPWSDYRFPQSMSISFHSTLIRRGWQHVRRTFGIPSNRRAARRRHSRKMKRR